MKYDEKKYPDDLIVRHFFEEGIVRGGGRETVVSLLSLWDIPSPPRVNPGSVSWLTLEPARVERLKDFPAVYGELVEFLAISTLWGNTHAYSVSRYEYNRISAEYSKKYNHLSAAKVKDIDGFFEKISIEAILKIFPQLGWQLEKFKKTSWGCLSHAHDRSGENREWAERWCDFVNIAPPFCGSCQWNWKQARQQERIAGNAFSP